MGAPSHLCMAYWWCGVGGGSTPKVTSWQTGRGNQPEVALLLPMQEEVSPRRLAARTCCQPCSVVGSTDTRSNHASRAPSPHTCCTCTPAPAPSCDRRRRLAEWAMACTVLRCRGEGVRAVGAHQMQGSPLRKWFNFTLNRCAGSVECELHQWVHMMRTGYAARRVDTAAAVRVTCDGDMLFRCRRCRGWPLLTCSPSCPHRLGGVETNDVGASQLAALLL
jgi:hypothetical protein